VENSFTLLHWGLLTKKKLTLFKWITMTEKPWSSSREKGLSLKSKWLDCSAQRNGFFRFEIHTLEFLRGSQQFL